MPGSSPLHSSGRLSDPPTRTVAAGTLILACSPVKGNRAHRRGGGSSPWKGVPADAGSAKSRTTGAAIAALEGELDDWSGS
jgi:hypothetical protein